MFFDDDFGTPFGGPASSSKMFCTMGGGGPSAMQFGSRGPFNAVENPSGTAKQYRIDLNLTLEDLFT